MTSVVAQARDGIELETIVVDDGSTDGTAAVARSVGAITVVRTAGLKEGNPGAARNLGAAVSTGDPIIFLDVDCTPEPGWLGVILAAHDAGAACVGGSLALPPGLSVTARLDYYCSSYHQHPRRPPGIVANHSPANFSVRRSHFDSTRGFAEDQPVANGKEELPLQADLRDRGAPVHFEPAAVVAHRNRPGLGNFLRRNYRWGYPAIEAKARTRAARWPWVYRFPRLLIVAAIPLAFVQTAYVLACWGKARRYEALAMSPAILLGRLVYAVGMIVGGVRWLRRRRRSSTVPVESRC